MDLHDLIAKERASGCADASVFGGFGRIIAQHGADLGLPELATLGQAYSDAPLTRRPALLDKMERLLLSQKLRPVIAKQIPLPAAAAPPRRPDTSISRGDQLTMPLTSLKSLGDKRAQLFAKLGVTTLGELLEFYPRDYLDRRAFTLLADLQPDIATNICGMITRTETSRSRRGMSILACYVQDDSDVLPLIWFNQQFLEKKLRPGRRIAAWGRLEQRFKQDSFIVQDYQLDDEIERLGGIMPVYQLTAGLTQKMVRYAVETAWPRCAALLPETLPAPLIDAHNLLPHAEALHELHFPVDPERLEQARRTLAYTELLTIQLAIRRNAAPMERVERATCDNDALQQALCAQLPYALTGAQQRVITEIYADMDAPLPMARLIQGDVGSGKTTVAAAAMLKCCAQGKQAALMAPTEILAQQHAQNLTPLLTQLGLNSALLTGAIKGAERRNILARLAAGELNCIIGTHALIQDEVEFAALGLAVTDEQHRFGVAQRARLRGMTATDMLIMTATPIPRTLSMTVYADLKLSVIDELPPGRKPVKTYAVDYSYEQRINKFIDNELHHGSQVFIVCPLIEDSEKMELDSAIAVYERLSREVFPQWHVGLLHGRMKPAEKEQVMTDFRNGRINILVSTTVIEVGVDIPNATLMVIRDAERFGLAQLHQLRGRVGRGRSQSYCVLLHNAQSQVAHARMRIISQTTDGFKLAEADLEQRGPGEFFGQRQHGLPELKIADLSRDTQLLAAAHQDADQLDLSQLTTPMTKKIDEMLRLIT